MTEIINAVFDYCRQVLALITTYWILSIFFLIGIFRFIVELVNNTKSE